MLIIVVIFCIRVVILDVICFDLDFSDVILSFGELISDVKRIVGLLFIFILFFKMNFIFFVFF